jgi:hypothetical protein
MPALTQNGTTYIIHSNYYYKSPNSNPFAPHTYWNVTTHEQDIIPVVTIGYKTDKFAKLKIKENIPEVKEINFIHRDTEGKMNEYMVRTLMMVRG